jgi:hypothetical protein
MIEIIASCIGGVGAIVAAGLGLWNRAKIMEVHVMVNNQHDQALLVIQSLKDEIVGLKEAAHDSRQH